ncbi:MAG TPA: hypothetical protein VFI02_21030 [Armatimonadota bacterium]|nr:hypothetical protein [Armatimonadota bacterium]
MKFAILILFLAQSLAFAGPTRVTIDGNRFLMNDKPWFPMCLSPGPPPLGARDPIGRDALAVLAEGGIDSFRIHSGPWARGDEEQVVEYMDWLAANRMYAFLNLRELSVFTKDAPKRPEGLGKLIERFNDHPALAMWKCMDEPAWGNVPIDGLVASYKFIKQHDPDHPVWMAHAPRNTIEILHEYCKYCDATGLDIYPIGIPMGALSHLPNKDLSMVGDYCDYISAAVDGKKPFIMVLQVCWSGVMPPHTLVFPTFRQERYMAYQAIIKGARGLFFFGMNLCLEGRDAELGYNWTFWNQVMRPLLREIGEGSELHSALLAPDSKIPLKVSGAPDIEFTAREVGPFLYIFAAKREGSPAQVRFSGDVLKGEVEVMFEGRTLSAKDGTITDRFERNDVHVYKVRLR